MNIITRKKRYWYKESIWYEMYINLFYDSNKDGIGDIQGLIEKIPYLKDLGIDTLLLLPFYPSTMKDYGYDVTDYLNVRKEIGNIDEFKILLKKLKENNIKVIIDLVINHTSYKHPWFEKSKKNISLYKDYYLWEKDISNMKKDDIIFNSIENSNWEYSKERKAYYYHKFYKYQPDLNWNNPLVFDEFKKIISFYTKLGVSGFRIDAALYIKKDSRYGIDEKGSIKIIHKLLEEGLKINKDIIFITEIAKPLDTIKKFLKSNIMTFNFDLMPRILMSLKMEDKKYVEKFLPLYDCIEKDYQVGNFLRNHDGISLQGLNKKDQFIYFNALNTSNNIFSGEISERLINLLEDSTDKVILGYSILFFQEGAPIIYMGDERGEGNITTNNKDSRMDVRGLIQWDKYNTKIYKEIKKLIAIRKKYIQDIVYSKLIIKEYKDLLFFRKNNILFIFNLSKKEIEIELQGEILYQRNIIQKNKIFLIENYGILLLKSI